jgi:hypothetical protein
MAKRKPTKSQSTSPNIRFLDQLAAKMAADWVNGDDVLGQFESMSGPEAAYLGVIVFGVLGEAVKDGYATETQQKAFLKALERASS